MRLTALATRLSRKGGVRLFKAFAVTDGNIFFTYLIIILKN